MKLYTSQPLHFQVMNKIFFLTAAAALTVLLAGCSKGERGAPDGLACAHTRGFKHFEVFEL